ncbi:uncharacterized protein LOC126749060 isoform X2 [Anthonomus grandis grandis]|uniref:uncharacterized protein LOC126749060 isoform X2 n=1 Tax=Anthonomus grandis grandis TaxID=2921223 RepID=UPI00216569EB|nr:uncharacterized protein LOC126749060 isoform X2 [Anthonomus grandis grandis]
MYGDQGNYQVTLFGSLSWYEECTCCPYGYHIDLDFVRYCESISKEDKNRTGSIKRRKDRRKQRQSMEMLLGLTPPVLAALDEAYKPCERVLKQKTQAQKFPKILKSTLLESPVENFRFNADFDDAVSDFEKALQRSKKKLSNNLPDVTAVSDHMCRVPSIGSLSLRSECLPNLPSNQLDAVSTESFGLSPMALQTIRDALALSLERTKQLENEVKHIPGLQAKLLRLRTENQNLNLKLRSQEYQKLSCLNGICVEIDPQDRKRSEICTDIDTADEGAIKERALSPPRKDFGVMCGVLTRNIGVGNQIPITRNVSTITTEYGDKWLSQKEKFLNSPPTSSRISITKGTQTVITKEKRDMSIQTSILEPKKDTRIAVIQTDPRPMLVDVGSLVIPTRIDVGIQNNVECVSIGSSEDTINGAILEKNMFKNFSEDFHPIPISLATLGDKSKSFNLGEERLNLKKHRTQNVATQFERSLFLCTKSLQTELKTSTKSSQYDIIRLADKNIQYENNSDSKLTDTNDLQVSQKSVSCQATPELPKTKETSSNTVQEEKEVSEEKICAKCSSKEMETAKEIRRDIANSPTPSRIPILTSPIIDARKLRRQDTYTKIYSSSPTDKSPIEPYTLSGLDLSPKTLSTRSISPLDNVKSDAFASSSSKTPNDSDTITKVHIQEATLPVSESTIFELPPQRKKTKPSKEMQGAMKVLNDLLQKNQDTAVKNHSAINIVQTEWFRISSYETANPLDVEDYLDAFEDVSSVLFHYIVNMTDASGNTAMHYAVSHGNFDVVSILLDSKVCDINRSNKAGYTCVMLVSLAQVKNQTDANVVRRLFHLADVNIRASQHGQTALMLAVSHGRLDMVKMLLEAGADINIQDEDGSTALMCAAEHGHIEIVKHFLSQLDCDSNITDLDGSTALKIAMEAGHRHIGVLLYAHERRHQKSHSKIKITKSNSPKAPSSPLPIRNLRALSDKK